MLGVPTPTSPRGARMSKELLEQMVELLKEQQAEIWALRSVAAALINTHPNRVALQEAYLVAMDLTADSVQAERMQPHRAAHQRWLSAIATQKAG